MVSGDWICRSLNCHDQMMGYLSMNWMGHEAPRVEGVAKDHVWEEGEAAARSHALVEMVQGHGEEGVGSGDQRVPWTHQSGCGHSNHHRNYPANTQQVWWETNITCNTQIKQESIIIPEGYVTSVSALTLCTHFSLLYTSQPTHFFPCGASTVEKIVYFCKKMAFFEKVPEQLNLRTFHRFSH